MCYRRIFFGEADFFLFPSISSHHPSKPHQIKQPLSKIAVNESAVKNSFKKSGANGGELERFIYLCKLSNKFVAMIEVKNIIKRYGTLEVLKGVSVSIGDGEIVSIVGPSGAGKTTLLQIIGTLDKPESGEVLFNGTNVLGLKDKELARFRNQNIGFVFQFHQLLPEFTTLENVAMPALIGGAKRKEAFERAKELLDYMNLTDRLQHKPSQLSGGERQRVAVARALINKPAVVLADEPSGSLDTQNKQELHRLFFKLRNEMNQTFVIVTHDESLAGDTDRVLYMRDGMIVNPQPDDEVIV